MGSAGEKQVGASKGGATDVAIKSKHQIWLDVSNDWLLHSLVCFEKQIDRRINQLLTLLPKKKNLLKVYLKCTPCPALISMSTTKERWDTPHHYIRWGLSHSRASQWWGGEFGREGAGRVPSQPVAQTTPDKDVAVKGAVIRLYITWCALISIHATFDRLPPSKNIMRNKIHKY